MLRLVPSKILLRRVLVAKVRLYSSSSNYHGHGGHGSDGEKVELQQDFYRPGADSYAYDNPWPKLNKGRLDWMFQDGWRRPLAKDQGGKLRREWLWYNQVSHDEHKDWIKFHIVSLVMYTITTVWLMITWTAFASDWPYAREWALREAHLEIARREKAGLPYISKDLIDPERVTTQLPSEEELRDVEIII